MPETLTGTLKRIRYEGRGSWSVVELQVGKDVVTVTGPLPGVHEGDELECEGEWTVNPKFGRQFQATRGLPVRRSGIESFLQLLPNVGPKRAAELRERFGDRIWDVLTENPEELRTVAGLTDERITGLREEYLRRQDDQSLLVWCLDNGVSAFQVGLIRKHFKEQSYMILKADTYRITEVDGIGFLTADKISMRLGVSPTSNARCRAAILYALKEIEESEGSTLIEGAMLMACLRGMERGPGGAEPPIRLSPPLPEDLVYQTMNRLKENREIFVEGDSIQAATTQDVELRLATLLAERITGQFVLPRDDDGMLIREDD